MSKKIKLIGISVVAIALLGVATFFAFNKGFFGGNGQSGESQVITTSDQGGSCLVTYFPTDGDIEITIGDRNSDVEESGIGVDPDPANWRVRDMRGNRIDAEVLLDGNKLTIKAPEGGYESGGIYVLDIGEGAKFAAGEYGNSKHLVFGVERGMSETVVLNENVYEIEKEEVNIDGESISIAGQYEENDILLADFDGDMLIEAIKLVNVTSEGNNTQAVFVEPTIDEVYEELDIFTIKECDFNNAVFAEGVVVEKNEGQGFLEKFIEPVYADDTLFNDAEVKVTLDNEESEKAYQGELGQKDITKISKILNINIKLNDLKYDREKDHPIDLEFNAYHKADGVFVINETELYIDLDYTGRTTVTTGVTLFGEKPESESVIESIKSYHSNSKTEKSELNQEKPIAILGIPIAAPIGLYINLDVELKTSASANLENSLNFELGVMPRVWFVRESGFFNIFDWKAVEGGNGINHSIECYDELTLSGKAEFFLGLKLHPYIGIPGGVEVGVNASAGPYAEIEGGVQATIPFGINPTKEADITGFIKAGAGVKFSGDIALEVPLRSFKDNGKWTVWEFLDEKINLWSWDSGEILESVGIKEQYVISDGKVSIGDINATFIDVFEVDPENLEKGRSTESIEKYTLYLDGKKVENPNEITGEFAKEGEHTIKIAWMRDGDYLESDVVTTRFVKGGTVAWVLEPTDKYSDIGQLETTRGRWVKGRSDEEFFSCIMNNIGYPQQWFEAVVPESYGVGSFTYSADAVAIESSSAPGKWGIIDYSGKILVEPTISSAAQNPYPFRGISKSYSGLGYQQSSAYAGSDGLACVFPRDYSGTAFEFDIPTGGGVYSAYYFAHEGKLYRYDNVRSTEVISVPEQLKTALVPGYGNASMPFGPYVTDYTYITKAGEIITQEVYYVKNYVNGYYVGLPEMAENSYDPSSGDLVYGASFVSTPVSPNQKFAIIEAASGKPITEYKYYDALYFEEGLCPVSRDGKWGFIDESGREVTEMLFDKASTVYDGKAAVIIDGKFAIINIKDSIAGGLLTEEILDEAVATSLKGQSKEKETEASGNESHDGLTGLSWSKAIYKGVLDSIADGTGNYQLHEYMTVKPERYAFVDLNQDGFSELLIASIDEMDPGVSYVTVFYYDSNSKSVKQATGELMFGAAGAGGFRGGLGIYKNEEGKDILLELWWGSGSGAGQEQQVYLLDNGTIEKVFFKDFQLGDDNKMPTECAPIEWSYFGGFKVVVSADDGGVSFRSGPGVTYEKLISNLIPKGTELTVLKTEISGDGVEWGLIEYDGKTGWIALTEVRRID